MKKVLVRINNGAIQYSNTVLILTLDGKKIFKPTEDQFRAAGFIDAPTCEVGENQYVKLAIVDGEIVATAAEKKNSFINTKKRLTKKHVYSKLKTILAAEKAGIAWSDVEDWMKTNNLYTKWMAAQELADDYEGFEQIIALVKQTFSEYDIDAILESARK